jgi:uncharacterized membrane protein YoaK (UPF0700 family)
MLHESTRRRLQIRRRPAEHAPLATPNGETRHKGVLARNRLLLLLTLSSGSIDAICYLKLGKVFTAFMTGNFVFLGLRISGSGGPHLAAVLVSLGAFGGGVHVANRFLKPIRWPDVWPGRVTAVLGLSVVAQTAFLALWLASGRASQADVVVLLGISALAMGLQTAAVFSLGLQGVFTTAATATFTVLSGDTAHWANTQPERRRLAALLIALAAGAVAGGLLAQHAVSFAPILPLVASSAVVVAAKLRFGQTRPSTVLAPATGSSAGRSTTSPAS